MAEFESLFFSTWDDSPWNGPSTKVSINSSFSDAHGSHHCFTASVTDSILSMTSLIEEPTNCFTEELLENIKRYNNRI